MSAKPILSSQSLGFSNEYKYAWSDAAFTTNLSSRLALKVGYDLTYKNQPAFVGVDVIRTPVTAPPVVLGQVPFQLKKTDSVFTTSLVITF